tara:strand:- start:549 stop:1790 length:1242 start_codon:yes stop_codon:yes gene_type:complete
MSAKLTIGVDLGTSGVRAAAISENIGAIARSSRPIAIETRRDPNRLFFVVMEVLADLATRVRQPIEALAICGTSGSFVPLDQHGNPSGPIVLYSDKAAASAVTTVAAYADPSSPVHGPNSPLAKISGSQCAQFAFEADFVAGKLMGARIPTDANNALKAGGDPMSLTWPRWTEVCTRNLTRFPKIVAAGTALGNLSKAVQVELGFQNAPIICAGTTDGCAAALAAGLHTPGDAVTSLGSTLILKVISSIPIVSTPHGIYSHRLLDTWLVGGASNAGGAALRRHFSDAEIVALSKKIVPTKKLDLGYVPLVTSGERFPFCDPYLRPRFDPRPHHDEAFLQGILESLVRVEHQGYLALQSSGAPAPLKVSAVGNGTKNSAWMGIRKRVLPAPLAKALFNDPASGAAILAANRSLF